MNDDNTTANDLVQSSLGESGGASKPKSDLRIVKIEPRTEFADAPTTVAPQVSTMDFAERARALETIVDKIAGIVDGSGAKVVEHFATRATDDTKKIKQLVEAAKLSDESREVAKTCGARILARHVQSDETVDILGLTGVAVEWLTGLTMVVVELRKIEADKKRKETIERKSPERQATVEHAATE